MRNLKRLLSLTSIIAAVFVLNSCDSSEDTIVNSKGKTSILVTDAAADNISSVYLSISEVQAKTDSVIKTVVTFDEPQVFDIMDYQNGETYALGDGELEVGTYEEIRFILSDENYVEFEDGSTAPLKVPSGSSSGYKIKGDFEIESTGETELVADIDLRKALVKKGNGGYNLRPTARVITADNTGTITGSISTSEGEKLIIYAYAAGTYEESEADEPAEGSTRFEGAVNSAAVTDGTFTLAFMEEGEYELKVATYEMDSESEEYIFKGVTNPEIMLDGVLLNVVEVEANSEINLVLDLGL